MNIFLFRVSLRLRNVFLDPFPKFIRYGPGPITLFFHHFIAPALLYHVPLYFGIGSKSFTTLFVDGNHENHPLLSAYPVEGWRGGKVHSIQPSVLHLMRGQVFDIDGTSIFTMGGASSHDKEFRVEGRDWWQSELPSELEYEEAQENLERHSWNVDLVITHCAPTSIQQQLASWYIKDQLTNFLDVVVRRCATYQHWCFGHYHVDMDIGAQHHALYYKIWEFHK